MCVCVCVCCAVDLEHRCTVRRDRHNQFAKQFRMSSHFISAKTDDLVDQCFTRIAAEVMGVRLSTLDLEKTAVSLWKYSDSTLVLLVWDGGGH